MNYHLLPTTNRTLFLLAFLTIGGTLSAQRAATILDHQDRIRIAPVKALNSPFRETNLSITPDGKYLYFMSLRGGLENSSQIMTFEGDSVYDGDIWYSERVNGAWQRPKAMPSGVNTANGEDEPVVSADGKRVYFQSWNYIWDRTGGPYFVSELQGNIWTRPVGLGGGITEFFSVVQATDGMTISPDERTMIVAAGQGYDTPMDIYISKKGEYGWTYCKKLAISTEADERSVFLAPDGKTLYFASKGYRGLGGLDIYKTTLNPDGTFGEIINIGAPFNTPADDYGFILTGDGMEAYFVRNGDIYFADLREADSRIRPEVPVITHVLQGTVRDSATWRGVPAQVLLLDARTKRLVKKVDTSPTGAYRIELPNVGRVYDQLVVSTGYPQKTRRITIDQKAYPETITANFLLAKPSSNYSQPSAPIAAQPRPQQPANNPRPVTPVQPVPAPPAITHIEARPQTPMATPPPTITPPLVVIPPAENPYSFDGVAENNLILLLDVSASMRKSDKLPLLKEAFSRMLVHMRPEDQITIIVYSGTANVVLEAVSASQQNAILAAIDNLSSSGGTKGKTALRKGYSLAKQHFISGGNNRIILATDGYFEVEDMYIIAESGRSENVTLSVFSFGKLAQDKIDELAELAAKGGGNYAMITEENVDTALLKEAKAVRK
ncbi:MAG: VWA domain-containing protein [Bacteroidia bacterium]|nr:VWA domain-containing protein [Bacteroidia bacterium]